MPGPSLPFLGFPHPFLKAIWLNKFYGDDPFSTASLLPTPLRRQASRSFLLPVAFCGGGGFSLKRLCRAFSFLSLSYCDLAGHSLYALALPSFTLTSPSMSINFYLRNDRDVLTVLYWLISFQVRLFDFPHHPKWPTILFETSRVGASISGKVTGKG